VNLLLQVEEFGVPVQGIAGTCAMERKGAARAGFAGGALADGGCRAECVALWLLTAG